MAIRNFGAGGGGAAGGVGLLDTTYAPVGLWYFDSAAPVNLGTAGTGNGTAIEATYGSYLDSLDVYNNGDVVGFIEKEFGCLQSNAAPSALLVTGDVTLQVVYTPLSETIDSFGSILFAIGGDGASSANNEIVMLQLGNFSGKLRPSFRWEYGSSSRVTVTDTGADMAPGIPHHIQCRRFDAGGDSWTGQLYIDGIQIAEVTAANGMDGGSTSKIQMGRNAGGDVGVQQALYGSVKLVDRKLTDVELTAELALTGLDRS